LKIVHNESYSYAYLSLWIVFISYYGDIFNSLKELPTIFLSILGGIGGSLAYWTAYNLGAINLYSDSNIFYLVFVFILWGLFFPFSMWLFYEESYWNYFLDKTIVFSFDKTGFKRHKSNFNEDLSKKNLQGKIALVTGGTSGIGGRVVDQLENLGAKVFFTGRNRQKGDYVDKSRKNLKFFVLDMAKWNEFFEFCKNGDRFDYIVLNAGGMPSNLVLNEYKFEHQCASQLLGHYFLIHFLRKFNKINKDARIVWISSGGMLLKKLDIDSLFLNKNYNKVSTYANVKRAQVTLVEELSKQNKWKNINMFCMHPGWVSTLGLNNALPKFFSLMKNRLRTSEEGSDTILWLLLTEKNIKSGGFYFDRKIVSPYITNYFNPSIKERMLLLKKMEEILDKDLF